LRPHYVHNPQPDQSLTQIICSVGHRFLSKRLTAPPALSYYSDRCLAPLPNRIASSRDFWCGPLSGLSAHISHLSPTIQDGAHSALPRVASGVWWTREDHNPAGPTSTSTALCDGCTMTRDCRTAPWFSHSVSSSRFSTPAPGVPQPCTPPPPCLWTAPEPPIGQRLRGWARLCAGNFVGLVSSW
jgi:hypothetical protein